MASFSDTKITPANGQKIPTVDGSTTGYMLSDELKAYILSALGQANGIASLGADGKLVSTQLPDFANDVLAFDSIASFPATGTDGVLYIAKDENTLYRWNGSGYVVVSDTSALEERVDGLETEVSTLETSSTDHGSRITNLETEVEGLESDVDEHADRLAQYDFREVDPFEGFVLEGDSQKNLETMVRNSDVYEQDAIMLSIEPVIPSASTHNFGIRGQIAIDDSYLYVCVADNAWKKIPLQNL